MAKISADEAIKRLSNQKQLPVGKTCLQSAKQYRDLKNREFEWNAKKERWESEGPSKGLWYIGWGKKVISCGSKGTP